MKIQQILDEYDRIDTLEEDKDLCEFFYLKLDEYDISTPDELENVKAFFQDLSEEWIEDLNITDMMDIYEIVCETYEDPKKINIHFLHKYINEKMVKVVRDGKIVKKKKKKKGFVIKNGKYVKQSKSDRKKLSKTAKKSAKKKRGKKSQIARKVAKSKKKRKNF